MFQPVLTACAICLGLFAASPSGDYVALRQRAEFVRNLGRFLESYIGDCERNDPDFDRRACEAESANVQREAATKTLRIEVDDPVDHVRFGGWNEARKAYVLRFTPFFSERGIALVEKRPTRLTKDGLPVVPNLPIWISIKKGSDESDFRRRLERGKVRLEVLFRPTGTWAMRREKVDPPLRGVAMKLVGVRVYAGDSDDVLGEQVYR